MKKILKYFAIYYILGIVLMNAFIVSRFLGSANVLEIGPRIIMQNMSSPVFYGLTLVWPLYLGLYIYNFATGNFGN